jgi:hypothetical protein
MLSAGFEPAIPAIERLQAYTLDRTATGIGEFVPFVSTLPDPCRWNLV